MSYPADCPGCAIGYHERHDPEYGHRSGLIGGTICACSGDCGERYAAVLAEIQPMLCHRCVQTTKEEGMI